MIEIRQNQVSLSMPAERGINIQKYQGPCVFQSTSSALVFVGEKNTVRSNLMMS